MGELGLIIGIIVVTTGVMVWLVKTFSGYLAEFDRITNSEDEK